MIKDSQQRRARSLSRERSEQTKASGKSSKDAKSKWYSFFSKKNKNKKSVSKKTQQKNNDETKPSNSNVAAKAQPERKRMPRSRSLGDLNSKLQTSTPKPHRPKLELPISDPDNDIQRSPSRGSYRSSKSRASRASRPSTRLQQEEPNPEKSTKAQSRDEENKDMERRDPAPAPAPTPAPAPDLAKPKNKPVREPSRERPEPMYHAIDPNESFVTTASKSVPNRRPNGESIELVDMVTNDGRRFTRIVSNNKVVKKNEVQVAVSAKKIIRNGISMLIPKITVLRKKGDDDGMESSPDQLTKPITLRERVDSLLKNPFAKESGTEQPGLEEKGQTLLTKRFESDNVSLRSGRSKSSRRSQRPHPKNRPIRTKPRHKPIHIQGRQPDKVIPPLRMNRSMGALDKTADFSKESIGTSKGKLGLLESAERSNSAFHAVATQPSNGTVPGEETKSYVEPGGISGGNSDIGASTSNGAIRPPSIAKEERKNRMKAELESLFSNVPDKTKSKKSPRKFKDWREEEQNVIKAKESTETAAETILNSIMSWVSTSTNNKTTTKPQKSTAGISDLPQLPETTVHRDPQLDELNEDDDSDDSGDDELSKAIVETVKSNDSKEWTNELDEEIIRGIEDSGRSPRATSTGAPSSQADKEKKWDSSVISAPNAERIVDSAPENKNCFLFMTSCNTCHEDEPPAVQYGSQPTQNDNRSPQDETRGDGGKNQDVRDDDESDQYDDDTLTYHDDDETMDSNTRYSVSRASVGTSAAPSRYDPHANHGSISSSYSDDDYFDPDDEYTRYYSYSFSDDGTGMEDDFDEETFDPGSIMGDDDWEVVSVFELPGLDAASIASASVSSSVASGSVASRSITSKSMASRSVASRSVASGSIASRSLASRRHARKSRVNQPRTNKYKRRHRLEALLEEPVSTDKADRNSDVGSNIGSIGSRKSKFSHRQESSEIEEVEDALAILRQHAKRLGLNEKELLSALQDAQEMDEKNAS